MRRLLFGTATNTARSWAAIGIVVAATVWSLWRGAFGWTLFGAGLAAILLLPAVAYRSRECTPPSPVAMLGAVTFAVGVLATVPIGPVAPLALLAQVAAYVAVAAAALAIAVEVDAFTRVELHRGVAVAFVVMTTMTVAGLWQLAQWGAGFVLGTSLIESNEELMWRLIAATITGLAAGIVFDQYLERLLAHDFVPAAVDSEDAARQFDQTGDRITDALSRRGVTERRQRQLVRVIQAGLLALVVLGFVTLYVDIVASAGVGLIATVLPRVLTHDEDVRDDAGLALWIAIAVGLHAIGTLAFYQTVWGWHKVTHSVSGSMIALVGYTVVRTVERNSEAVSFPSSFTLLFVVLFTFTAGVFWEIFEFTLDGVVATFGQEEVVLTQHGLFDTTTDMIANTAGALVVAVLATSYETRRRRGALQRSEANP